MHVSEVQVVKDKQKHPTGRTNRRLNVHEAEKKSDSKNPKTKKHWMKE